MQQAPGVRPTGKFHCMFSACTYATSYGRLYRAGGRVYAGESVFAPLARGDVLAYT